MSTVRQKRIAKLIIENETLDKPLNAGQLLEKVSYGKISKQPSRILKSAGVQEALEDYGFTEDNAKKVVCEIMLDDKKDPNARLKATDQVFKVRGTYAPEVHKNLNVIINLKPKEIEKLNNLLDEAKTNS
jgi:hypothetical protein